MTVCPFAAWKPVANHGGPMSAQLGLVLHVQEGNGGLSGWFNNPTSGASSTFWVSKTGALEQYVDCNVCAWAQGNGNSTYQSVETEGYHDEALTAAQESMLARLYTWGSQTYAWPNLLAETPGDDGFGWHGMGGSAWGGHTGCPGDLRDARRGPILAAAFGDQDIAPAPPAVLASGQEDAQVALTTGPDGSRVDLLFVETDNSVAHWFAPTPAELASRPAKENLGGQVRRGGGVSGGWTADKQFFVVTCEGTDNRPYQNISTRATGKWSGWTPLGPPNSLAAR
jgi:hypothetical protein